MSFKLSTETLLLVFQGNVSHALQNEWISMFCCDLKLTQKVNFDIRYFLYVNTHNQGRIQKGAVGAAPPGLEVAHRAAPSQAAVGANFDIPSEFSQRFLGMWDSLSLILHPDPQLQKNRRRH